MKQRFRRAARYARVAAHVGTAVAKVSTSWGRWCAVRRRAEVSAWSRTALQIFGFKVVVTGAPHDRVAPAPLIVANHVSWLDIYAILAHVDASFVAKSEVRRWPAVGWLAERLDTLFLDRERRTALVDCIEKSSAALAGGRSIVIFPEGTTTDGSAVLPFHASLFEAAIRAGVPVQPVAIRYRRPDGSRAVEAAFVGDQTLVGSFRQLADGNGGTIEICFLPTIASHGRSRAKLAVLAEQSIRGHLQQPFEPSAHVIAFAA